MTNVAINDMNFGTKIAIFNLNIKKMVTIIKKGSSSEEIKKKIHRAISKSRSGKILKYAGKLKLDIDPLVYQRQIRDEWE